MPAPRVGVLALQGDVAEHLSAFAHCGVAAVRVRLPAELDTVDALAIPGGESTTMSRLLRVFGLDAPLRDRLARGMPVFATCAGMILMSRAILDGRSDQEPFAGIDIAVRRNAYGRQVDSFETDLPIPALGDPPFRAVFIRAPAIEEVGPGVEVLAELGGRPVAVAQEGRVALSFHPEMTDDTRLHRLFLDRAA